MNTSENSTMLHLWDGNQVNLESGMFAGSDVVKLMFPAEKLLGVTSHVPGTVYEEGRDFTHAPGSAEIRLVPGSRIPYFPESALHPTENLRIHPVPDANAIRNAVDGGYLLYNNWEFFTEHQVDISYIAKNVDLHPALPRQLDRLPRFREKLAKGEPVRVTLIGDSISQGYNSTKFIGREPFMPCYMELICNELQFKTKTPVNLQNLAITSTGITRAQENKDKYLPNRPDLLAVAYGMNNMAAMPADEFIGHMDDVIAESRAANPHTEYLIITFMTGNPLWKPTVPGPDAVYADAMRKYVAGKDCHFALADVQKVWRMFLERKSFYDLSGNGVNHPNDYGHRIYASVILDMLLGNGYW
ncbi:MAG: SGNH/GDSL hydrolase family protein [Lentisphaeria bacterium]|nr:SGNH/GDSL hydrolase family protein [Lentisphaeria bacterium]